MSRGVLLGDAGYWHQQQMERIVDRGIAVLIPPDAKSRKGATFVKQPECAAASIVRLGRPSHQGGD
jgi:hypothetical protein